MRKPHWYLESILSKNCCIWLCLHLSYILESLGNLLVYNCLLRCFISVCSKVLHPLVWDQMEILNSLYTGWRFYGRNLKRNRSFALTILLGYRIYCIVSSVSKFLIYFRISLYGTEQKENLLFAHITTSIKPFCYLCCQLWRYFTHFSSVSIVDIKQVNVCRIEKADQKILYKSIDQ